MSSCTEAMMEAKAAWVWTSEAHPTNQLSVLGDEPLYCTEMLISWSRTQWVSWWFTSSRLVQSPQSEKNPNNEHSAFTTGLPTLVLWQSMILARIHRSSSVYSETNSLIRCCLLLYYMLIRGTSHNNRIFDACVYMPYVCISYEHKYQPFLMLTLLLDTDNNAIAAKDLKKKKKKKVWSKLNHVWRNRCNQSVERKVKATLCRQQTAHSCSVLEAGHKTQNNNLKGDC